VDKKKEKKRLDQQFNKKENINKYKLTSGVLIMCLLFHKYLSFCYHLKDNFTSLLLLLYFLSFYFLSSSLQRTLSFYCILRIPSPVIF
jgi:hypothetical protein